jgi:hypothetical protein
MHIDPIAAFRLSLFCLSISVLLERIDSFIESEYYDIACRHFRCAVAPALQRMSRVRGHVSLVAKGVVLY